MTGSRALRIAFYAPLKSPDHPVPSGDRLMARMLITCLRDAGHQVNIASHLRAYLRDPLDVAGWARLQDAAAGEVDRIGAQWAAEGVPDLWFSYHPYYKSPDLIGPALARPAGARVVTCEASWSARRNHGIWAETQARAMESVAEAALNLCVTARDRAGLLQALPEARLASFPPFLDPAPFAAPPEPQPGHLVLAAMMREGDKFASYGLLAAALALLPKTLDWRLTIAGDGPVRAGVEALFARFGAQRVQWLGQVDRARVAQLFARGAVYVWPGTGEAYGLAYLEAQAAGLPVVAQAVAGVPEVVQTGVTGLLTAADDAAGMAGAIARLLTDAPLRRDMGRAARDRVWQHHSQARATERLDRLLCCLGRP